MFLLVTACNIYKLMRNSLEYFYNETKSFLNKQERTNFVMKTVILELEVSRLKSPDKIFSLHEAENFENNFSQIFVKSLSSLVSILS